MSRILVMGVGGIGGQVAGALTDFGVDVTAVTTNERIFSAVKERGFVLREAGEERAIPGAISMGVPAGAPPFDIVILATQPPQVEAAARTAAPHIAAGGQVICLQNGLCELRVAEIVGAERVVGCVVAWGGSMPEPGVYDKTAAGSMTLGRIDGSADGPVREAGGLLEPIGPVHFTSNLMGARWSKLALNCVISSLGTIGGARLGRLVRVRRYRRLGLEIMTEVVAVAEAEGVRLEKVAGTLDPAWIALTEAERTRSASAGLTAKHALILAVGLRYRRLRSSMLSAIERGRVPAIDFLNGEVCDRAKAHGIKTPVNQDIVDTVHAIARGEKRSSTELLDEVCARARAQRGS